VDTTGYKQDISVHKSFAELLMRRMDDDGVRTFPGGSVDYAPIIGKLGTGVEFNELYTDFQQGALRHTGSDFDLGLDGKGFFAVQTPQGERYTRDGNFHLGKEGYLETKEGYKLLGENGPLRVQANNFKVDKTGAVWINKDYAPNDMVEREKNTWDNTVKLDNLKIVDFANAPRGLDRYLQKQGNSLYKNNELTGEAVNLAGQTRPQVEQGYIEGSNVDPVTEMVRMIEINRAYEANQKTIQAGDSMLGTLINQTMRVA
jgi:flagellar basal-body rod protein FlgG